MAAVPRILIVEDDPATLAFLGVALAKAGYHSLTAPSGKEGLIEAWRNHPDLIILDLDLPDINGVEVVRKLRGDHRTAVTKIVILSGQASREDVLAVMQAGADEFIPKRVGAHLELLERVHALAPLETDLPTLKPAGKLVSFLSAKGGTGTSSICANMAHSLAGLVVPARVAVVDLVLPIGSIGPIIGVDAGPSSVTVVTLSRLPPAEMTPAAIEELLPLVPGWQFHLLAGATDPQAAQELEVGHLDMLFKTLLHVFDYVLIDFGRALSRVSLPFIRASLSVVVILSVDISSVASTKTVLKYLDTQGVQRNRLFAVINRAVGLEGMSRPEIEKELGLPLAGLVPHMGGDFALANNLHKPIAVKFPNHTSSLVLRQLAQDLLRRLGDTPIKS